MDDIKNKIPLIAISLVVIFLLLFGVYKLTNNNGFYPDVNVLTTSDHVKWSPEKKNILVEYSDFQCPACKEFNDILKNFEATESADFYLVNNLTFVFRHFPLYQIHDNAYEPAYAAEAAGKQKKFYQMVDILYDKQSEWSKAKNLNDYFVKYAKELSLNIEKFKKDITSDEVKNKVEADLKSGEKADINATPTFFLNGKKLEFNSLDEFKKLLKGL